MVECAEGGGGGGSWAAPSQGRSARVDPTPPPLSASLLFSTNLCAARRASGISSVYHTQGQCAVRSSFLLSSACQRDASVELVAPEPEWTQGLTAAGTGFSCALGESAG